MSLSAENVIGAIINEPEQYWKIADIIEAGDFPDNLSPLFAVVSQKIKQGDAVDAIIMAEEGYGIALELASNHYSSVNIVAWAKQMAASSETARVRKAAKLIHACKTYVEAQEILAGVRPEQAASIKTAKDACKEMYELMKLRMESGDAITGVPTGITGLDKLTSGFQPGNLIVMVGETSMGKSTLAIQSALEAARWAQERGAGRVLYFSLEMTARELFERMTANQGNFPLSWLTDQDDRPDEAYPSISTGAVKASGLPISIDDRSGLTLDQIVSTATQMHMQEPLVAVFVDYMHIMGRPRRNDVTELGAIASGLKNLSKQLSIPVVGLHQLNRAGMRSEHRRPSLADIRASGEIAETANLVLGIYQSRVANPQFSELYDYAEVLILKNRQGRRDVRAWARNNIHKMRFDSCEPPDGYDEKILPDKVEQTANNNQFPGSAYKSRQKPKQYDDF